MGAILDLCKLDMMKGSNNEMLVISVFMAPENIGLDTKMKFIQVSDDEL